MTKVVRFHETGGPEVLKIEEIDVRPPAAGEVTIAVRAIGLNRAESMFRNGAYLEVPQLPATIGYEAAGVIEQVGPGVEGFAIGDAVSVVPSFAMNEYGMYGEKVNAPVHAVVRHPAGLSWEVAAAVWMQYMTAYGALIDIAKLSAGETVVITAASSSVGIAAIQVARMVGATPLAVTRTAAKRAELLALGAAQVIVSDEQDLVAAVLAATNGKGARVVFDPVGGPMVATLADAMAQGGILFQYGALSTEPTPVPLMALMGKSLTIRGYVMAEVAADPARLEQGKRFIVDGLASGALKPVIAKTFAFDQIVEAHRYMESNQQIGKIVVTL